MRIYWKLIGAHVHCKVFTTGLCGTLVFDDREWPSIRERLERIAEVKADPI